MQKEFEEASFTLKPGEVSGVIETASGLHIIERYVEMTHPSSHCCYLHEIVTFHRSARWADPTFRAAVHPETERSHVNGIMCFNDPSIHCSLILSLYLFVGWSNVCDPEAAVRGGRTGNPATRGERKGNIPGRPSGSRELQRLVPGKAPALAYLRYPIITARSILANQTKL